MKISVAFLTVLILAGSSCKKDKEAVPVPAQQVFLKDIIVQNLPSPYYHFEYTSGRVSKAGFASGARMYEVQYEGARIREMKNNGTINKDRVIYEYDLQGRVAVIKLADEGGAVYRRSFLTYGTDNRLIQLEWEVKIGSVGFAIERTLDFTYHNDGNLKERRDHRHFIDGRQNEAFYTDRFEQYDDKINVDDFSLLHEGVEHLVLLPGLRLQRNNPLINKRTGDGVNYDITYTYTYAANRVPLQKKGDMVLTNGPEAGQHTELLSSFSYYE